MFGGLGGYFSYIDPFKYETCDVAAFAIRFAQLVGHVAK